MHFPLGYLYAAACFLIEKHIFQELKETRAFKNVNGNNNLCQFRIYIQTQASSMLFVKALHDYESC